MKQSIQTSRRAILASTGIFAGALLMHAQLADALIVRGDQLSVAGNRSHAAAMYRRALLLDPGNPTAVDRTVFEAILSHRRVALREAVSTANAYLERNPGDDAIRNDEALALQVEGRFAEAEAEFERVGHDRHDAQAMTFAGLDALHRGDRRSARRLFGGAVRFDSKFLPALRRLRST